MTWPDPVNRIPPAVITDEAGQALAKTPTLPDGSHGTSSRRWPGIRCCSNDSTHSPVRSCGSAHCRPATARSSCCGWPRRLAAATNWASICPSPRRRGVEPTVTALLRVGDDRSGLSRGTPCSWTTDAVLATGTVDDDLWSRLAQRFDEPQLIELLVLIGTYRMVADLLNVAGVQLEPDMKAEVSQWI